MINDPLVSDAQSTVEEASRQHTYGLRVFTPTFIATALMAGAIAALAVTSLAQPGKAPTAQLANTVQAELPLALPLDSGQIGPFAFGYLVFENDPLNGVPGFGPPPPSSAR